LALKNLKVCAQAKVLELKDSQPENRHATGKRPKTLFDHLYEFWGYAKPARTLPTLNIQLGNTYSKGVGQSSFGITLKSFASMRSGLATTRSAFCALLFPVKRALANTTAKYGKKIAPAKQTHINQPFTYTPTMMQMNRIVIAIE
jgi:hypothetical protein